VPAAQAMDTFPEHLTKTGRDRQDTNTEMFPSPRFLMHTPSPPHRLWDALITEII